MVIWFFQQVEIATENISVELLSNKIAVGRSRVQILQQQQPYSTPEKDDEFLTIMMYLKSNSYLIPFYLSSHQHILVLTLLDVVLDSLKIHRIVLDEPSIIPQK